MEQDRGLLLQTDVYARSRYKESTSLSNKKAYQTLNLCKVTGNQEIPIVMGLTHEQAREYEISLLYKQLQDTHAKIEAVRYFLHVDKLAGVLEQLKEQGNIAITSVVGARMYTAFQPFDLVYKYGNEVGYVGKTDEVSAAQLFNQLEGYLGQLSEQFDNPVIDLQGAVWLGASDGAASTVEIQLTTGEKVVVPKAETDYRGYFGEGILEVCTVDRQTVYINRANVVSVRLCEKKG